MDLRATLAALLVILAPLSPAPARQQEPFWVDEALTTFPATLDPHLIFNPGLNGVLLAAYETPLQCDPDSEMLTLAPLLLAEMPKLSEDGLRMSMRFRSGVRFHDDECFEGGRGRELTAEDFLFTIKRHIDPETKSVYFAAYLSGWIAGVDDARAAAVKGRAMDYDAEIAGLRATSKYEVEITFTQPYPQFAALLTMSWTAILPKEAVRRYGSGLGRRTVGTGPYRYDADGSTDKLLLFKRNDSYWNAAAGGDLGPLPRNAGVRFHLVGDVRLAAKRYVHGDLTCVDLWPMTIDDYLTKTRRVSRKVRPRGTRLIKSDRTWLHYIAFNMKNKILADVRIRRALALGLDRRRLVREVYRGAAVLADHVVPPSLPLHAPRESYPWEYGRPDLRRAKALLAEAGYPNGEGLPEFVLEAGSELESTRFQLELIQKSWAKIGVKTQVRTQPYTAFLERVFEGLPEISVNYWYADYPDAENFFLMLRSSAAPRPGVRRDSPNTGFYANEEYDRLYHESVRLLPGKARGKLYARMIEIIQGDCPWIFVAHQQQYSLVRPDVGGVRSRSVYRTDYSRIHRVPGDR